jgi:diadenosine tetraphosphatase ApaH/serine/threonine PP2A family protein phosphatase
MRYLVITDIHANLEALDACLADARARGFDEALVLGDLVGYGPDPNLVVERVVALNARAIVRGNHDKVACGLEQAEGFNAVARSAAEWTLDVLTQANREWLAALPAGPTIVDDLVEICHGSPFDEDAYIFDELDAVRALKVSTRALCLFGHTHYPVTFELSAEAFDTVGPAAAGEAQLPLKEGVKYLVNPGSVGQPRDGDPRAAYAIVDTSNHGRQRVELYRLQYAVQDTQSKIIAAGLPDVLAQRLGVGR